MMQIEKKRLLGIYRTMLTIRRFEEKALELFEANLLRGSVHLYIGEEAIAATICSLLQETDYITSTHRGHGHCIAKGADVGRTLAELMGREPATARAGAARCTSPIRRRGISGQTRSSGREFPSQRAPLFFRPSRVRPGRRSVFRRRASRGAFHEALNLGALWKLPAVYVCENNGFGISVAVGKSTSVADISQRAAAYGSWGTVDGNDVFAIDRAARTAIARARAGEGRRSSSARRIAGRGIGRGIPRSTGPGARSRHGRTSVPSSGWRRIW